jgi:hypothetical protein
MMNKMLLLGALLISSQASAVILNQEGVGQVLIAPYYSVNNGLSTLVTVTNHSPNWPRAIKINIREGLGGQVVKTYNVYLDAGDSWAFGLISGTSQLVGFEGQDTMVHFSDDSSCTPLLNRPAEEASLEDIMDGPEGLLRVREGFIEILEMAEMRSNLIVYVDQGNYGRPANCMGLEDLFTDEGGIWNSATGGDLTDMLSPAAGELSGEVSLIDVANGINYSYSMLALNDFFPADLIPHVAPDDASLSLDAAKSEAWIQGKEQPFQVTTTSGIDAVSAVMMAERIETSHSIDSIAAGKAELVITQPTRHLYRNNNGSYAPPYPQSFVNEGQCVFPDYQGTEFLADVYDREAFLLGQTTQGGLGINPPPPPDPKVCGSTSVLPVVLDEASLADAVSTLTGSPNVQSIHHQLSDNSTESGHVSLTFLDTRPLTVTRTEDAQTVELHGLPVTGILLQRFTNAAAAPGLLAQYGGSFPLIRQQSITEVDSPTSKEEQP